MSPPFVVVDRENSLHQHNKFIIIDISIIAKCRRKSRVCRYFAYFGLLISELQHRRGSNTGTAASERWTTGLWCTEGARCNVDFDFLPFDDVVLKWNEWVRSRTSVGRTLEARCTVGVGPLIRFLFRPCRLGEKKSADREYTVVTESSGKTVRWRGFWLFSVQRWHDAV